MEFVLLLAAMAFLIANHNRSRENRQRIANLEEEIAGVQDSLEIIRNRMRETLLAADALADSEPSKAATRKQPAGATPDQQPARPVATPPAAPTPGFVAKAPSAPEKPVPPERPVVAPEQPAAARNAEPAGATAGPQAPAPPAAKPPPPPHEPAPPPPPSGPSWSDRFRQFDWESLIGVRLFSWIAGIALALASVFFIKYSFDQGILTPPIRMAIGLVTGIGLLLACELRVARGYRHTANAMDGAGIAILYATLFSSSAIWKLLPTSLTFALMILVTAVAVLLSVRRDSPFIAVLGLVGGFATPAMLSTGENRPIVLFSYLLMLNAGLAWVAYRKRWPLLSILALAFTTLYQWGWVVRFLNSSTIPLAIAIFLAFPILGVAAFFLGAREKNVSNLFGRSAATAAIVPVAFAAYLAAVPAYGDQFHLLFGFLLIVGAGLALVSASSRAPEVLHLIGAFSAVLVVAIWTGISWSAAAWPAILLWISSLAILYALVPIAIRRFGARFGLAEYSGVGRSATWAAPLFLFVFPVIAAIEARTRSPLLLFATLFALLLVIAFSAIRLRQPALVHVAAGVALLTEIVWSARYLAPETLASALVVYLAFTVLFVGISIWMSRRNVALRYGSAPYLVAGFIILFMMAGGSVASVALPALTLLMFAILAGLFIDGRGPLVVTAGLLLSWLVLQIWWSTADVVANLIPALAILAALSIFILAGSWWLNRKESESGRINAAFALVGHLFLVAVAMRPDLAVPPGPLFAVLALLTVAIAIGALLLRDTLLLIANLLFAQVVLAFWAATASTPPYPSIAILATLLVAAFGVGWSERITALRQWSDEERKHLILAIFASLFSAQLVTMVATSAGEPPLALIVAAHLIVISGIFFYAVRSGWQLAPVLVAVTSGIAMFQYRDGYVPSDWNQEMILALALYLPFIIYPFVLGRRALGSIQPYLAAIVASAAFFWFALVNLKEHGYADVIGILPIAQAVLLSSFLLQLRRIEPPAERNLDRLALVAGVALAFVTVAIPLQLENEWITIAWALEAAALVWLFPRVPHRGLLMWAAALVAIVFVRLSLNPAVLSYHPRSDTPIFNWHLYTYLTCALAFFAVVRLLKDDSVLARRLRAGAAAGGTILLFLLLNIEIADFFSKGPTITFNFSAGLAQNLTYTLGWAVFAIALLVAGLVLRSRPARIAAIGLLTLSVFKGFLSDVMQLGGLYRVASLVGLAIALAMVAVLLQKFILSKREDAPRPTPEAAV
ncbi:MAG: DUF2339 domain-containing protein [Acidobacteria bacterium]|nr:DUF2339 domain-containing protein [Acidobacteriota bacterium]